MTKLREWADRKYGKEKVTKRVDEIISMIDPDNAKTMKLSLSQDKTLERLEKLIQENSNIEYINTGSALVEYALSRVIDSYEFVINCSLVLGDIDTSFKLNPKKIGNTNALGNLINEFERFSKNEKLRGMLGNFNGNRKKVTHKLYEKHIDIEEVNQEIRSYVEARPISEILREFAKEHDTLVRDLTSKLVEYGCVIKAPPDLDKIRQSVGVLRVN